MAATDGNCRMLTVTPGCLACTAGMTMHWRLAILRFGFLLTRNRQVWGVDQHNRRMFKLIRGLSAGDCLKTYWCSVRIRNNLSLLYVTLPPNPC